MLKRAGEEICRQGNYALLRQYRVEKPQRVTALKLCMYLERLRRDYRGTRVARQPETKTTGH